MKQTLTEFFHHPSSLLQPASEADIVYLVPLINEAYSYQDTAKGGPRTSPEHLRKRFTETDFYTIKSGEKTIGCVYLQPKEAALHFGLLTLSPEFRGKGIAADVVAAIEQYAHEGAYETIDLDYMSLAPWLKTYYEKYGFKESGAVINWGTIDLIHMSKPACGHKR